jgi:DNA-directed RNA polymerase specialized sigma24 family protein
MVILCKQAKSGRFDLKYDLAGFLFTVSKNLWINKVKKESRMVKFENQDDITPAYDFTSDIITNEKARTLKEIIQRLGEKCFRLLQLAVYQQLDNNEICTVMGFSTLNAVKTQKYKCKQKLIGLIESNPTYKEVLE